MATLNETISQLVQGAGNHTPLAAAGALAGGTESVNALNNQLDQLRGLFQAQAATTRENTEALTRNTVGQSSLASSIAAGALNTVTRSSGSAFSALASPLAPVVGGLLRLFGRGGDDAPPALPSFSLPRAVAIDGSIENGGNSAVTSTQYAQDGLPRVTAASGNTQRVTVQVNAMDARSFLDRSDDIARAVKDALLNSHSVGDVIGEL